MKDASDFSKPAVIVNEVIISRQDTCRIGEMFHLFKHNYLKLFDTTLSLKLVVLDLSWASIHAALGELNMETIGQYAKRVFQYANFENVEPSEVKRSFLSSCVSHTMHRFTTALKKAVKFFNNEVKTFAVCSFSLLVNCTDFESSKQYFH